MDASLIKDLTEMRDSQIAEWGTNGYGIDVLDRAIAALSPSSDRNATQHNSELVGLLEAADICDKMAADEFKTQQYDRTDKAMYACHKRIMERFAALKKAAPQVPSTATRGVGDAEVGSRDDDTLEPATSVQAPIASPVGAAPATGMPRWRKCCASWPCCATDT